MSKTILVEFLKDRVMFLSGKRVFCTSNRMKIINKSGGVSKDKNGEIRYRSKRKYRIPSELHDEFVEKGIITSARKVKK